MEQVALHASGQRNSGSDSSIARISSYTFLLIGLVISLYLLYRYQLIASNTLDKPDVCSAVFGRGCDAALKSDVSSQLGLPLAAWGFLYYATLSFLSILRTRFYEGLQATYGALLLLISFAGCLVSLTLLCMMIIDPKLFCPLCIVLHVLNLFLFISVNRSVNLSQDAFFKTMATDAKAIFTRKGRIAKQKRMGVGVVLLLVVLLYSALNLFAKNAIAEGSKFDLKKYIANYDAANTVNIPIDNDDPVLGDIHSPIEIITFSDFQCISCQYFYFATKELNKRYPGKIHVIFKYFPLGKACNASLKDDVHPRACEAAMAAEAAKRQGKFWEFHDAIFPVDLNKGEKTICMIADSVGLAHADFERYRVSAPARNKVERDIELGLKLGISATPTVFVNRKQVDDFRLEHFLLLIDHLLGIPPRPINGSKTKTGQVEK